MSHFCFSCCCCCISFSTFSLCIFPPSSPSPLPPSLPLSRPLSSEQKKKTENNPTKKKWMAPLLKDVKSLFPPFPPSLPPSLHPSLGLGRGGRKGGREGGKEGRQTKIASCAFTLFPPPSLLPSFPFSPLLQAVQNQLQLLRKFSFVLIFLHQQVVSQFHLGHVLLRCRKDHRVNQFHLEQRIERKGGWGGGGEET